MHNIIIFFKGFKYWTDHHKNLFSPKLPRIKTKENGKKAESWDVRKLARF